MAKKQKTKPAAPAKDGKAFANLKLRAALIVVVSCAGVVCAYFGISTYIDVAYADKVYPGIHIGSVDFTGSTQDGARTLLETSIAEIEVGGISTSFNDTKSVIASTVAAKSGIDTAFPLFAYDVDAMVAHVFAYGRNNNGLIDSWYRLRALVFPQTQEALLELDAVRLEEILREQFSSFETPPIDADLAFAESGSFTVEPSSSGQVFDYDKYIQHIEGQLKQLEKPEVRLALVTENPAVSDADAQSVLAVAEDVYARAPFLIAWEEKTWEATKDDVAKSLTVEKKDTTATVVFNPEGLDRLLSAIRQDVDIEAKNARFAIEDGKVVEFQKGQAGRTFDLTALVASLNALVDAPNSASIPLVLIEADPEVTESEADDLGVTELVATATTNFAGSPTNRRKNIANGVSLVNGTLIKPGETYSLVEALSPIEVSNGFFSELVIKGNRTIPEVGGGLCQVSTTLFRTAMGAGLPIAERKNHSYRVSYYEPPVGMDATIYDPAPDFKFTNDYDSYLLLVGSISGDNITFELWGTKDGRIAETTEPRMYNVVSPGPTQYIETDDLAPGEQKCIERAHNGATADFTYTVSYPDGEKKTETFVSKYKAWQAVCLVGKAAQ